MTRPRPEAPVALPAGGQRDGPPGHREGTGLALHAACSDAFSLRSVAFPASRPSRRRGCSARSGRADPGLRPGHRGPRAGAAGGRPACAGGPAVGERETAGPAPAATPADGHPAHDHLPGRDGDGGRARAGQSPDTARSLLKSLFRDDASLHCASSAWPCWSEPTHACRCCTAPIPATAPRLPCSRASPPT